MGHSPPPGVYVSSKQDQDLIPGTGTLDACTPVSVEPLGQILPHICLLKNFSFNFVTYILERMHAH